MKSKFLLPIITTYFCMLPINAEVILNKGIYGNDDRKLLNELDQVLDKGEIKAGKAVLAQIPKWKITDEDDESISIATKDLKNGMNFCLDEKFSDLPMASSCSSFLVAPDLMLTAGHCLQDLNGCQNNYWVLDYDRSLEFEDSRKVVTFQKEKIVSCDKVLSMSVDAKLDYALIKLNRKIIDREALKIRRSGKIKNNESLMVIGHPLGLPKIFTENVSVLENSKNTTFLTNADTFSGNSGSPVINQVTKLVEGILIKGGTDFKFDLDMSCNRAYRCHNYECEGETVGRILSLPLFLIPKI